MMSNFHHMIKEENELPEQKIEKEIEKLVIHEADKESSNYHKGTHDEKEFSDTLFPPVDKYKKVTLTPLVFNVKGFSGLRRYLLEFVRHKERSVLISVSKIIKNTEPITTHKLILDCALKKLRKEIRWDQSILNDEFSNIINLITELNLGNIVFQNVVKKTEQLNDEQSLIIESYQKFLLQFLTSKVISMKNIENKDNILYMSTSNHILLNHFIKRDSSNYVDFNGRKLFKFNKSKIHVDNNFYDELIKLYNQQPKITDTIEREVLLKKFPSNTNMYEPIELSIKDKTSPEEIPMIKNYFENCCPKLIVKIFSDNKIEIIPHQKNYSKLYIINEQFNETYNHFILKLGDIDFSFFYNCIKDMFFEEFTIQAEKNLLSINPNTIESFNKIKTKILIIEEISSEVLDLIIKQVINNNHIQQLVINKRCNSNTFLKSFENVKEGLQYLIVHNLNSDKLFMSIFKQLNLSNLVHLELPNAIVNLENLKFIFNLPLTSLSITGGIEYGQDFSKFEVNPNTNLRKLEWDVYLFPPDTFSRIIKSMLNIDSLNIWFSTNSVFESIEEQVKIGILKYEKIMLCLFKRGSFLIQYNNRPNPTLKMFLHPKFINLTEKLIIADSVNRIKIITEELIDLEQVIQILVKHKKELNKLVVVFNNKKITNIEKEVLEKKLILQINDICEPLKTINKTLEVSTYLDI